MIKLTDLCDGILDVSYHNRRVKNTCVSDIIAWLLEVKKIDKVPYFVVDYNGVARLPTFNIDDVTNVALCERFRRLEAHISMLDQSVAQHTVQLIDMKQHEPASGCDDAHPIELLALMLPHKAVLRRDILYLFPVCMCQVPNIRQNPVMCPM